MDEYMLPCLNKKLFGFECLGCGIQRATVLFFRGEFYAAFQLYPAIYTLLILAAFLIFNLFVKFNRDEKIRNFLIIINLIIIISSYIYKHIN